MHAAVLYNWALLTSGAVGTAIYLCIENAGPVSLLVDGTQFQTTGNPADAACALYGEQAMELLVAEDLPLGVHSATLQVTDDVSGPVNFYGATVTMNAGQPGPKRVEVIDDTDIGWTWRGQWNGGSDDPYMWDGGYRSGLTYGQATSASYTFKGAYGVILRGLSMCNYGPYSITLGSETVRFDATDIWWRHSQSVLYFTSGLDATQSYTITITDYDDQSPNALSTAPCGVSSASVDALYLIMDDTATRDALLAAANCTAASSNGNLSAPTAAPASPTAAIVGGVLGALLLLMLGLVAFLLVAWRRLKKEVQSARYSAIVKEPEGEQWRSEPTPWGPQFVSMPPPAPSTGDSTNSLMTPSPETYTSNGAQYPKPNTHTLENYNRAGLPPLPPQNTEHDAVESHQPVARTISSPTRTVPAGPRSPDPPSLGDLVANLTTVLNGHLHQEYLREEQDGPPEYGTR